MRRVARTLLAAGLMAAPLLLTLSPAGLAGQLPQGSDAPVSRPDSLRLLILERARPAPVEEGAPPGDSLAPPPAAGLSGGTGGRELPPRIQADIPASADSLMIELLQGVDFDAVSYVGDRAEFDGRTRQLVLFGSPEERARFSGDGNLLEADSTITYSELDQRVRTTGATTFTPASGEPVESEQLIYDIQQARGTALGARTTYSEGAMWLVQGNLDSVQEGLLFASSARFTTCELEVPHSYFQAAELKVVANQVLVARSVTMYVEDVPVLWLPFLAQNLGSGRASGILTPTFSVNDIFRTTTGYNRRISNLGYYWAASDYADLTLAMDWYANQYTAGTAGLRYRWAERFMEGQTGLTRYWRTTGQRELALRTNNRWQISERSSATLAGSYISNSDLIRQNSLDPREFTQSIDSNAALNRRFDWGTATLGASRRQFLTDERTEMTLPSASLSLSTLTLFRADPESARWYNNVSAGGSTRWTRNTSDRALQPDSTYRLDRASFQRSVFDASGSLGIGDFRLNGRIDGSQHLYQEVPDRFFPEPIGGGDFRSDQVNWSSSLGYTQRLIGTTTLSPSLSIGGRMVRVDSIAEAREFVQGPVRLSYGLALQTDLYGFYRGVGAFEAIRHKLTPGLSWSYSPEVTPDALQERVFGARSTQRTHGLTLSLNQTWEAKARPLESVGTSISTPPPPPGAAPDAVEEGPDGGALELERDAPLPVAADLPGVGRADGLVRLPPSRVVTLLGISTSALAYDLVRADSTGRIMDGFTSTTITNSIQSDYLRGLDLSVTHSLFEEGSGEGGRSFAPHLTNLSVAFALDGHSGIIRVLSRVLGLEAGPGAPPPAAGSGPPEEADPFRVRGPLEQGIGFDPNRIIPASADEDFFGGGGAGWQTSVQYFLQRPRGHLPAAAGTGRSQMLQSRTSFAPSPNWRVSWSTSYDLENQRFNDHIASLQRDLHEWEATFSFRQTPTGLWSFQFEVALRANRDLRFDFEQRSLTGAGAGF